MCLQRLTIILCLTLVIASCAPAPPHHQGNICHVFRYEPKWYWAARRAQQRWGVPIHVQMAILHKESHFRAGAVPPRRHLLGVIPWFRQSSAYGYAQVTDETWHLYKLKTHQHHASRSNFRDADDFIAWFVHRAHIELGIPVNDAFNLYLAYHEGIAGYRRRTYQYKPHLIDNARRVSFYAKLYRRQLRRCEKHLPQKPWWHLW